MIVKARRKKTYFFHVNLLSREIQILIVIWCLGELYSNAYGLSMDSVHYEEFRVGLEFRPRTEFRNGYRQLRNDTTRAAFFTDQRSRLTITYLRPGFMFHTSVQDVRIWGERDTRSTNGTLQVYEAFVETKLTKEFAVRIGRQKIMYDNQRLFAQNNWRQSGGAHDAIRFVYAKNKLSTELLGAFNQNQERFSGTTYNPDFKNYKVLLTHFLLWQLSERLSITTLNVMDGYQQPKTTSKRFTSGGRITLDHNRMNLTLAAYYQYGKNTDNIKLQAYYLQPEIQYTASSSLLFRLGAEVFSGNNGKSSTTGISYSFDALYGVNHRFLGSMDYFTRFPADFNNAGIIAPYFFTFYNLTKKLTLRSDEHLFFTQNNFVYNGQVIPSYLGFENDLLFIYKPGKTTEIQLGFSYALVTQSMTYIKGSGDPKLFNTWAFLMITFQPELFSLKKESTTARNWEI